MTRNAQRKIATAAILFLFTANAALAQGGAAADQTHSQHAPHQLADQQDKALVDQIAELRGQIARLEAALVQGHGAQPQAAAPAMGRKGMRGMLAQPADGGGMGGMMGMDQMMGGMQGGMMGMMDQMMGGMGQMGGMSQSGGMSMPMGPGMGMERMMGMSKMGAMNMPGMQVSALPGFPGASHIYHVGATGFFLDHAEHMALTTEQQTRLGQIREKSLMAQATSQRSIEQAEQELWSLTGSDSPDAAKIEAKVREIEKLRSDQRITFIRAVGSAAEVLTDEQRKQLKGMTDEPAAGGMPGMGGH